MTFAGLFTKIGKQPIKNTQNSTLVAVFYREDLERLLNEDRHSQTVTIPLDLKMGTGKQKMWFVKRKEKHRVARGQAENERIP